MQYKHNGRIRGLPMRLIRTLLPVVWRTIPLGKLTPVQKYRLYKWYLWISSLTARYQVIKCDRHIQHYAVYTTDEIADVNIAINANEGLDFTHVSFTDRFRRL